MKAEIRRTKASGLYGAYASAACFLAALLIFGSEGVILLLGAASMFVYSIAIDRNARLEYDDDGITMYTVWGKPIPYRWSQIAKVDTAVEQLTDRRFIIGLVLRIRVIESTGKETVYRLPFKHYTGLAELLAFVNCRHKIKNN